jgi:biopolymer transport protein ExbD
MRRGGLAVLLLLAACGQPGAGSADRASGNAAAIGLPGDVPETAATLALSASGPNGCAARWDGQPAAPDQVLERSAALVEHSLNAVGGVTNLTEESLPAIAVEAPAALSFACADRVLSAVRRAGVLSIVLEPQGSDAPARADFSLSDIAAPPPSVVIAIGPGGRMTWNGEAVTLDGVADRVAQMTRGSSEIEAPPGELELRPAREASFGQVHAALRRVREGNVRAALLLPSAAAAPAHPVAVPPPTPAAPAAGSNATAG